MPKAKAKPRGRRRVAPDPEASPRWRAAVRLQAFVRGRLARRLVERRRVRAAQARQEAEAEERRRQALELAERRRQEERARKLRELRARRCTVELMCQGLPAHHRDWEARSGLLADIGPREMEE